MQEQKTKIIQVQVDPILFLKNKHNADPSTDQGNKGQQSVKTNGKQKKH
jgi:hypothetical protein